MMVMSRPLVKAAVQMFPVRLYRKRLMHAAMARVTTMATSTMPLSAALGCAATPVENRVTYWRISQSSAPPAFSRIAAQ